MKASHTIPVSFAIAYMVMFFAFSTVFSAPSPVSVESRHPLVMAQQLLKQAQDNYNKGNIEAVQRNLANSSKWLQDPDISQDTKTKDEIAELLSAIQLLQQKIKQPSDEHEGALSRLWHRSTAVVDREIQKLTKSWSATSTANKTLGYILDAKLHFIYAEHELFNSHNIEKANKEINKTIAYLDTASIIATPVTRAKITSLRHDIQILPDILVNKPKEHTTFHALITARKSLERIHDKNPEIQARVKTITKKIENLSKDVAALEKRRQYDIILKKFGNLDELLSDN